MIMKKIALSMIVATSFGFGLLQAAPYDIDRNHSYVNFQVAHMVVSNVDGSFPDFSGEVEIDPKTKTLKKLEGQIDITAINTRNQDRDSHLLGADYFDAGTYPKGTLKMTKVTKTKSGIRVEADLTLRGITKKVVFTGNLKGPGVNPNTKKELFGLTLEGIIKRKDFNIGKDTSSATMGDEVKISISLELVAK